MSRTTMMRGIAIAAGFLAMGCAAEAGCDPSKAAENYPTFASRPVKIAISPLYAPFAYNAPDSDKLIGSDVEISEAALQCVGLKYEYVKGAFTSLLPTVLNGQTDIMNANLFYNEERAQNVDFVVYMKAGSALLVPKGNQHNVKSMDDLCGLTTSAVIGTFSQKALEEQSQKCVAAGKSALNIVVATETDAAVRGLMNKRIDFLLDNAGAAVVRVKDDPNNLEIAFTQARDVKVGMAAKNDNNEILQAYLTGMKEIYRNGTIAKILTKYGIDPSLAIEPEIIR
ncbi:transporter substrate-binding domain-containing protein [Brucella cytisi]|uniref:transporter substrate-binding domain-containing protein n=1 Tax=Brucella cytisi TaxID=407152 RepID=UPI0035DF2083